MAHTPRITDTVADEMLDNSLGGAHTNGGKLTVYNGSQPTNGGDAITTQQALVSFTLPNPCFPAASAGVITANPVSPATALVSGTASWFRLFAADGTTPLLDGSVGVGAGFDLQIDNTSIVAGSSISFTSGTITMPES